MGLFFENSRKSQFAANLVLAAGASYNYTKREISDTSLTLGPAGHVCLQVPLVTGGLLQPVGELYWRTEPHLAGVVCGGTECVDQNQNGRRCQFHPNAIMAIASSDWECSVYCV